MSVPTHHRPNTRADTLFIVAFGVLMFCIVIMTLLDVFEFVNFHTPKSLYGAEVTFKRVADILSSVATILLAIIATFALWFARRQAQLLVDQNAHAGRARLAPTYLDISQQWDSDGLAKARSILGELDTFWNANPELQGAFSSSSKYIHAVIRDMGPLSRPYNSYVDLMAYIENLGLLCLEDYVGLQDINNIMGSGIRYILGLVLEQIQYDRSTRDSSVKSRALYANALTLYELLVNLKPRTIEGYGAY